MLVGKRTGWDRCSLSRCRDRHVHRELTVVRMLTQTRGVRVRVQGRKHGPDSKDKLLRSTCEIDRTTVPTAVLPRRAVLAHTVCNDIQVVPTPCDRVDTILLDCNVALVCWLRIPVCNPWRDCDTMRVGTWVCNEHQCALHLRAYTNADPGIACRRGEVEVEIARALLSVECECKLCVVVAIVYEYSSFAVGGVRRWYRGSELRCAEGEEGKEREQGRNELYHLLDSERPQGDCRNAV